MDSERAFQEVSRIVQLITQRSPELGDSLAVAGLDSLTLLEVVEGMERRLKVRLSDEEVHRIETIQQLVVLAQLRA